MELIIFSGIQGAGKSTFFRREFLRTHSHISLDNLKSREIEIELFAELVAASKPIVIDNTNQTISDRAKYIQIAKPMGYRIVGYQFEISVKEAIYRVSKRRSQKSVPAYAIAGAFNNMQALNSSEGFDEIFKINRLGNIISVVATSNATS